MKNQSLIYMKEFKCGIPIFLQLTLLILLSYSCKKENIDAPINQTNGRSTAVFNPNVNYGTLIDQDGNIYNTITINSQTWMAENLRTTKYRNGEPILEVEDNSKWEGFSKGAYCNYMNSKNFDTIATFGRLYNWPSILDIRNIAPKGWHVPTDAEWTTLIEYLGGMSQAGGSLKEAGTTHWNSPNTNATNETGFTALPGGSRYYDGPYASMGYFGFWGVHSTDPNTGYPLYWYMEYNDSIAYNYFYPAKYGGFSIRCIKD